MVGIQIELSEELNKKVALQSIERGWNDKRLAIVEILEKYFGIIGSRQNYQKIKRGDTNE